MSRRDAETLQANLKHFQKASEGRVEGFSSPLQLRAQPPTRVGDDRRGGEGEGGSSPRQIVMEVYIRCTPIHPLIPNHLWGFQEDLGLLQCSFPALAAALGGPGRRVLDYRQANISDKKRPTNTETTASLAHCYGYCLFL